MAVHMVTMFRAGLLLILVLSVVALRALLVLLVLVLLTTSLLIVRVLSLLVRWVYRGVWTTAVFSMLKL